MVDRGSAAKLTSSLTVAADPGQPTAGLAYVGAARAKDLAVNVVLPFFHALAEAESTGSSPALKLYRGFGKLQDNELTPGDGYAPVGAGDGTGWGKNSDYRPPPAGPDSPAPPTGRRVRLGWGCS